VNLASPQLRRTSSIRALPEPARRERRTAEPPTGLVSQVRTAFAAKNRLATFLGGLLGGGVPVATYELAHVEIDVQRPLWIQTPAWIVLGGLLFSAITVCQWGFSAFRAHDDRGWKAVLGGGKALGFTVILEGVLITAKTPWLSIAALCYLVGINAIATGVRLSRTR